MSAAPLSRSPAQPIRVMVADDSAIVRGLTSRWLEAEAGIELVAMALNGRDAVRLAEKHTPDVIILDVEMPELDGLGAIPELLKISPPPRILMASTLTHRNAEVTMKALALGATDYLPKPTAGHIAAASDFKRDLILRVRALSGRRASSRPAPSAFSPSPRPGSAPAPSPAPVRPAPAGHAPGPASARRILCKPAEIVVLGSSTGGPQALNIVVERLGGKLTQPLLIAQHMPTMFTAILAEHLNRVSSATVVEAKDGMPLKPGGIYVAPGDYHMRVARRHGALVSTLDQSPQVNFCRPAVDPLFISAAETCGDRALGVVLTGMGHDGRAGAEAIVAKGGLVLAQDEATSVVWGMPGAVAQAGLAHALKPLPEMAAAMLAHASGKA